MYIDPINYYEKDEEVFMEGLALGKARGYSNGHGIETNSGWCGKGANLPAFRTYAGIVISGRRVYPEGFDVERVQKFARNLLRMVNGGLIG